MKITTTGRFVCLECGKELWTDEEPCRDCGYPSEFIVHKSRLKDEETKKEIYREAKIMLDNKIVDITMDGMDGHTDRIRKVLGLNKYQADLFNSWMFGRTYQGE